MPFPDQLIDDDERVVKHLHPHWITLVGPAVIFIVTVGLASFLAAIVPDFEYRQTVRLSIGLVALVVLIWMVLIPVLQWRTTHYVITTHRVLIRTGILNHTGRDIPLQRINDVAFEQTLWDRIIGAGSLTVESAGERGQETLENIPHSDRVQQLLNRSIEEDHDRRAREALGGYPPPHHSGAIPTDQYERGPYGYPQGPTSPMRSDTNEE